MVRERRRAALLLAVVLVAGPALAGCLVADVPVLFRDPPDATSVDPGADGEQEPPAAPAFFANVTWEEGDAWAWQSDQGVLLVDRVIAERRLQRQVGDEVRNVTRLDVETTEIMGRDLPALRTYHTYEPEALGLVNSSVTGANASYFIGNNTPWRNVPLLFADTLNYKVKVNISTAASTVLLERTANITNLGLETVRVPAGDFQAWHVQVNITTRDPLNPFIRLRDYTVDRWFNTTVGNDVKYVANGAAFELVDHRRGGENRTLDLPRARVVPTDWGVGWQWTYASSEGHLLQSRVLRCGGWIEPCDGRYWVDNETDQRLIPYYVRITGANANFALEEVQLRSRGSLALVKVVDVRAWGVGAFEPSTHLTQAGVPLKPQHGTRTYVHEGATTSGYPVNHTVTASVRVDPAKTLATPLGAFEVLPVHTSLNYEPREYGQGLQENYSRSWSDTVRNDVVFERGFYGQVVTFRLQDLHLGIAEKWDREW